MSEGRVMWIRIEGSGNRERVVNGCTERKERIMDRAGIMKHNSCSRDRGHRGSGGQGV